MALWKVNLWHMFLCTHAAGALWMTLTSLSRFALENSTVFIFLYVLGW